MDIPVSLGIMKLRSTMFSPRKFLTRSETQALPSGINNNAMYVVTVDYHIACMSKLVSPAERDMKCPYIMQTYCTKYEHKIQDLAVNLNPATHAGMLS